MKEYSTADQDEKLRPQDEYNMGPLKKDVYYRSSTHLVLDSIFFISVLMNLVANITSKSKRFNLFLFS